MTPPAALKFTPISNSSSSQPLKFTPLAPKGTTLPLITPGVNIAASQNALAYPTVDMRDVKAVQANDRGEIRPDEMQWLKDNKDRITPEEFQHSLDVFSNKAEGQNTFTQNQYYFDDKGIPQAIKFGEEAPSYAKVQSVWGSQHDAEDDSFLTTMGKYAANAALDLVKIPATIIDLGYDLFGGEGSTDVGDYLRTITEAHKFETSSASKVEVLGKASGDPFTSMSEIFNSDNWHLNSQNVAGMIGSAVGNFAQLFVLGGGGAAAGAAEEGAGVAAESSLATKIAPYAKAAGANTLYTLNSAYDETAKAGLKGRQRFAVALTNALGQGTIMAMMFPEKPFNPIDQSAQKEISGAAVKAFTETSGGEMTSDALKNAYQATIEKSADVLRKNPTLMSRVVSGFKASPKTAAAMVASKAWDNGVMQMTANITGNPNGTGVFTPEAFKQYFNAFVNGTVMGVMGGFVHATPEEKDQDQSRMVYAYVKEGREGELIHNIDGLLQNQTITPEEANAAKVRIAAYKKFNAETSDVKLNDVDREEMFGKIWKAQGLQSQMDAVQADQDLTPAIREGKYKALHHEHTEVLKGIADIISKSKQKVETEVPEEVKAAQEKPQVVQKPVEEKVDKDIQKVAEKIAKGETDFTPEELQVQTNSPEEIEAYLKSKQETGTTEKSPLQIRRSEIVNKTIAEKPELKGYVHIEGKGIDKPALAGAHTIKKENIPFRKNLKVGDVLSITRLLPKAGEKYVSIKSVMGKNYEHSLNAWYEGHQVGSIKYSNDQTGDFTEQGKEINRLLDEGQDVKLVVTKSREVIPFKELRDPETGQIKKVREADRPVHTVEYQIVARPKEGVEEVVPEEKPAPVSEPGKTSEQIEPKKITRRKPTPESRERYRQIMADREERLATTKRLYANPPETFEESVLRFILGGGRVSQDALVRNLGSKIAKEYFWLSKKTGIQTDKLDEVASLETEMFHKDQQDAENEFFDVLRSHSGKNSVFDRLLDIEKEKSKSEYDAMMNMLPKEEAEKLESGITEEVDNTFPATTGPDGQAFQDLAQFLRTVNAEDSKIDDYEYLKGLVDQHAGMFDGFPFTPEEKEGILKTIEYVKDNSNYSGVIRSQVEEIENRFNPEGSIGSGEEENVSGEEKIIPDDRLKTFDFGSVEGTKQTAEKDKAIQNNIVNNPDKPMADEGESFNDVVKRVFPVIEEVTKNDPDNTVVVTHNSVFGLIKMWDKMGRPDIADVDKKFREEYVKQDSNPGDSYTIKGDHGTIHIVRHGETEDNAAGNFRSADTTLTEKGLDQASQVGKDLSEKEIPKIVSSSLPRALQTSNLIMAEQKGLPEIKYQTSETVKEFEKKVADLTKKLESAKKVVIGRRAELTKGKLADNEDLFGERKSQQEQALFDERASGDIEKIIQPEKDAVIKLERDLVQAKKDLESAKNDTSQTRLDFQSESKEPLASTEPELQKKISEHLSKIFPNVKVFRDPNEFQSFLDRNFAGAKLDFSKLGAAISDAVYIHPDRAVQSTQIHEHAHLYWGALGDDPIKAKLEKLFGDEESAVDAIGKLGTKAAKAKLQGNAMVKFVQYAKEFWSKVKNLFGVANKEDLAKIFASDLWKNAKNVYAAGGEGGADLKYMEEAKTEKQKRSMGNLKSVADQINFNPEGHTYTMKGAPDVEFESVNRIIQADRKYAYKGKPSEEHVSKAGDHIHAIAEAMSAGSSFEDALANSGLKISDAASTSLKKGMSEAIESLRKKGALMPETTFANSYFKTAGRPDISVIDEFGNLHIYDFKTSQRPTGEGSFYEKSPGGTKASKAEKHGVQLAMYALMAEHGDAGLGLDKQEIGETGIIPIRLKFTGDEVSSVEFEKPIEVKYHKYKEEARRLLSKNREMQRKRDGEDIKYSGGVSREQYFKKNGIDEESLYKELEDLPDDSERAQEIESILDNTQQSYLRYKDDYQKAKEIQNKDLSKLSYQELADTYNAMVGYDNLTHNLAMKDIMVEMGNRMRIRQSEFIKGKGGNAGHETDIKAWQAFMTAPSDITEKNPAAQAAIKLYRPAKQSEEQTIADVRRQSEKLVSDLIKEKEKNKGVFNKVIKSFHKGVPEKYFDNLFVKKSDEAGPAVLKSPDDASLSPAEKKYMTFVTENQSKYESRQATGQRGYWDGFYAEVTPNFWEAYYRHGLLAATEAKFREEQPEELGAMEIEVTNPLTGKKEFITYDQAEANINEYAKKGKLQKAKSLALITAAHAKAKKALDVYTAKAAKTEAAIKTKGIASRYTLNANGEMVSKFHWSRPEGKAVSYDVHRAFMSYMTDMIHIDHMQPILPEILAAQEYYKSRGVNPNMEKFMEHFVEGDIFGKEFVGTLGREVDSAAKFLQGWTYVNVMAFNPAVGMFNWTTGKLNQLRDTGIKKLWLGEKRYWESPSKAQAIMQHYNIVDPQVKGPRRLSASNIWSLASNGTISMGENSIRGAAFFSHLTKEEYSNLTNNFTSKGIVDPSKDLSPERVAELKKKIEDIQGKYEFADKRMYKHYGLMSAVMGFKGWMPDWINERFGGEYMDGNGNVHKGSYRSLPYIFRDLKDMALNTMKYINSDDINTINNKKNLREAITFASLMAIYSISFGDDKQKKQGRYLAQAATDMMGLLNLTGTKHLATTPIPFTGTIANFVDAFQSLVTLHTYQRDARFGKKGDYEFPGKILNIMPYNHVAKGLYQNIVNPDYKGQ